MQFSRARWLDEQPEQRLNTYNSIPYLNYSILIHNSYLLCDIYAISYQVFRQRSYLMLQNLTASLILNVIHYVIREIGNSDSPQRRLSNRLEPSSHVFRLAVKRGVGSGYVFDYKHFTRNICVLSITISANIPMMNVRYIYKSICYVSEIKRCVWMSTIGYNQRA